QHVRDVLGTLSGVEPDQAGVGALPSALGNIVRFLLVAGQYDAAEAHLPRMEQLCAPRADHEPLVRGWVDFGHAVRRHCRSELWGASGLFARAVASFEEAGEQRLSIALARVYLSTCYDELGAYAAAWRVAESVTAGSEPDSFMGLMGRAYSARARAAL